MSVHCYTKRGAGARDGHGWASAKAVDVLSRDLLGARAGDTFRIGFDRAREASVFWQDMPLTLRTSGAPRAPITIEAGYSTGLVDLVRAAGSPFYRNPTPPSAAGMPQLAGKAPLRIGANQVAIAGFRIEGASSDGFVKFAGPCSDIHISGLSAVSCGRVIETDRDAVLNNVLIENCDATRLVRGFARFRSLSNSTLRNLTLDAANLDGGGENVCQIIAVTSGRSVTFENVTVRRAVNPRGNAYAQGDGIVCERDTSNFTLRDCHGAETGDAAFDLKTIDVTLEDCTTRDCKLGARIWANGVLRRCAFSAPLRVGPTGGACLETKGVAELFDCRLQAGAGAAVFHVGERGGAVGYIRMHGGAIQLDRGATLVSGDPGGIVELDKVAVNGVMRSERIVSRGAAP